VRFLTGFIVAFFLLLVFSHFASVANFSFRHGSEQGEQAKTFYQPFHQHSQSGTDIPNAEVLSETEVEEKSLTDEDQAFCTNLSLHTLERLLASENLQLQFQRSLQNRPTQSLFILHHSWKSFLI
jgi:hypothetical protein